MSLSAWLASLFSSPARRQPLHAPVPIAVIGAGRMGGHHVRILSKLPEARLVGVVDADLHRATPLAERFKTASATTLDGLPEQPQAVVIAVPTRFHLDVARPLLEKKIACLIEKPIAPTVDEGNQLVSIAKASGAVLQVGHIERFNPAVMAAIPYVERPQFVEINRLGPYDPRIQDVGVVLDLMIHDLDMVGFLISSPVQEVQAFGAKVLSNHEDIAKVRLQFENGCIADLSASRVSLETYRRIRIFQSNSYMSIDYAKPDIKLYRKKSASIKSLLDIQRVHPTLEKDDALTLELRHFLACAATGATPFVTGEHGVHAVSLAERVLSCLKIHD